MKRRRSAAMLAWGVPLVAAIGATAVSSDTNFVAPRILAHEALPTTTVRVSAESVPEAGPPTQAQTGVAATDAIDAGARQTTPPSSPPRPSLDSDEYVLDIPSIDLDEAVVAGDQSQIDRGTVTAVDWSAYGYPASCDPGSGCTVWLAGHRSTHGAVFARLPELTVGASVAIQFHGRTYDYIVADIDKVPGSSPPSVIHGSLVLQTSLPGNRRLLISAEEVSRG